MKTYFRSPVFPQDGWGKMRPLWYEGEELGGPSQVKPQKEEAKKGGRGEFWFHWFCPSFNLLVLLVLLHLLLVLLRSSHLGSNLHLNSWTLVVRGPEKDTGLKQIWNGDLKQIWNKFETNMKWGIIPLKNMKWGIIKKKPGARFRWQQRWANAWKEIIHTDFFSR